MGKLFDEATKQPCLFSAWRKIRENGYTSTHDETRQAIELFDAQADKNIRQIQRRLRDGSFEFDPQVGVTKKKASGKGKRGIVMASVQNRVVERALLDTLQSHVPFVQSVVTTPTSIGGVPERSVPHGLKILNDAFAAGYHHFIRSDISGFFDSIPRTAVLAQIGTHIEDEKFAGLLDKATTVVLSNEAALGEDRSIFPVGGDGVAQGSPLSPLFGNVLLHEFDSQFNKDNVICVRFIDDFVMLSADGRRVRKAFQSATNHLAALGLKCHDPFIGGDPTKSSHGKTEDGFVFLGYDLRPGLFQPSARARDNLLISIKNRVKFGKKEVVAVKRKAHADNTQRYMQTMVGIDRAVRGWGNAFAYGNCPATLDDLDVAIDGELNKFRSWYAEFVRGLDWKLKRRTGGVCLLSDIRPKDLSDIPIRLKPSGRFVTTSKTITVSTDGSVAGGKGSGRDKGLGGWAYIIHDTNEEASGGCNDVTNNQMELQAVLEALKATPPEYPVAIRTDSQYVHQIGKGSAIAKSNGNMWKEFQRLVQGRKYKIIWVKGHDGDPNNERADFLAKQESLKAAPHGNKGVLQV